MQCRGFLNLSGFFPLEGSWTRGTPKSPISITFSLINPPFWGTFIYGPSPFVEMHHSCMAQTSSPWGWVVATWETIQLAPGCWEQCCKNNVSVGERLATGETIKHESFKHHCMCISLSLSMYIYIYIYIYIICVCGDRLTDRDIHIWTHLLLIIDVFFS